MNVDELVVLGELLIKIIIIVGIVVVMLIKVTEE